MDRAAWKVGKTAYDSGYYLGRLVEGEYTEDTISEAYPDPLSGEWADGWLISDVQRLAGIDPEASEDWETEAACDWFESAYLRGFRVGVLGHSGVTRAADYAAGMTSSEARVTFADGSTVSVGVHGYGYENRVIYAWAIREADYSEIGSGTDLRSGSGAEPDAREGIESLFSFLGAASESIDYRNRTGSGGENIDLFSEAVNAWIDAHSDEIEMHASDLRAASDLRSNARRGQ